MLLSSTITCPHCRGISIEMMATDACQFSYDCKNCGTLVGPLAEGCCVFCAYGDVPCPPVQVAGNEADCCSRS